MYVIVQSILQLNHKKTEIHLIFIAIYVINFLQLHICIFKDIYIGPNLQWGASLDYETFLFLVSHSFI